jgi:photosystem II stability/assembly factor-like uncharacterized protein
MKRIFLSLIAFLGVGALMAQTILLDNNNPETIVCGNSYNFYDAGGPSAPYSSGTAQTYTKTFSPSSPGEKIRIDFSTFGVENYFQVYMSIYNGPNTGAPLIGTYSGSDSPGTVVSTASGGELTVYFTHDSYQNSAYFGWTAVITCTNPLTPPANDVPCGGTVLAVASTTPIYSTGSLIGATNSTNGASIFDPSCSNYNNGPDVWFKTVVPASGNVAIITNDSTIFDTGIEVYKAGTCAAVSYLNLLGCDNDGNSNSEFGTMSKMLFSGQTPGDSLYVRVWKNNGGMGLFKIAAYETAPSTEVLYPNGGDVLLQNDFVYIDFQTVFVDTVVIDFSDNNGASWTNIAPQWPTANGSYFWTTPSITSTQCLIRVSKFGNPSIFDVSDGVFTITGPMLQVTMPNGGEIFGIGQQNVEVNWNSYGFYGDVNVLVSTNNGGSWTTLASNIQNYGYAYVDMPSVASTQCLLKVEDANDPSFFDESDANFELTNSPPSITVVYPVGGEVFTVGQFINIAWVATGNVSSVDIFYTDGDGGGTVALNVPVSPSYYYWQIPVTAMTGPGWQIYIQPHNMQWFTSSSNYFEVQDTTESIYVNYPYGGENWYAGSYQMISWSASQVSSFKVEYSTTGNTGPWTTIANNVTGSSYYWLVPNTPSNDCYVKISSVANSAIFDISYNSFNILTPPGNSNTISATYTGMPVVCWGDNFYVDFVATGTYDTQSNTFVAQLSDASGSFANPIFIGYHWGPSLTGTITCTMPYNLPNGTGYKVRVVADNLPTLGTPISNSISIDNPNAEFAATATVKYLPDGDVTFSLVGSSAGIMVYNWNLGEGGTVTVASPTHSYTSHGFYTVSLTTINSYMCSTTVVKPFYLTVENLFDNDTIQTLTTNNILGLSFVNGAKGCFALSNGTCLITQDSGATFISVPVGMATPLTSAALVPGFWLVTSSGGNVSLSTNGGTTWNVINVGTSDSLFASAFLDNTNGYVVGNNGSIFKYNGSAWSQENSGTLNSLRGVAFSDVNVLAVGYNGTIIHSSGSGIWTPKISPFTSHYRGVTFNDAGVGLAVGDHGRIIKTTDGGFTWTPVLSGINVSFTGVAMNGDSAWAIGSTGLIYKSFDAGNTWVRNSVGTQQNLNAITFYGEEQRRRMGEDDGLRAAASNRGYVVGDGGVARLFGSPIDTTGGSSVNELMNFNVKFTVYPVPAKDEITVSGMLNEKVKLNITLKDMFGTTVKTISNETAEGEVIRKVSLNDIASGVYFIHIENGSEQSIHRIVVAN